MKADPIFRTEKSYWALKIRHRPTTNIEQFNFFTGPIQCLHTLFFENEHEQLNNGVWLVPE